jgi:hypothetical protein
MIPFLMLALLAPATAGAAPPQASSPRPATSPTDTAPGSSNRIDLKLDTGEAEAVLAILAKSAARDSVSDADWRALFESRPYVRLKQREASMHRDFTDEDFREFVLSPALASRADSLRRTLEAWKHVDLTASARRVLAYLPDSAHIHASVYPVIKPRTNSFVFDTATDPAIFLYVDPVESAAAFENTVAHEMHHIGFSSVPRSDARFAGLSPGAKTAVEWMGAFGEGFAMLAAAGSPDVHPHESSPPETRARWDRDMANFDRDLRAVERFFLDVVDGRLKTEDEISKAGFSFFGEQGPWYTVGYRMAVIVEKRYGRRVLIECMVDPRKLLSRYNAAVASMQPKPAMWSEELLEKVRAPE